MLSISNTFRELTNANLGFRETDLHHEFGGKANKDLHQCVLRIIEFIRSRGNPYLDINHCKLYNFSTGESMPDDICEQRLIFFNNGLEHYKQFRSERFIDKSKRLSDTIKKVNVKENSKCNSNVKETNERN